MGFVICLIFLVLDSLYTAASEYVGNLAVLGEKMGKWGYFSNVGHHCQFRLILGRLQVIEDKGVYAMVLLCRGEPVVYKGGGSWGVVAQVVIPVRQGVNAVPNGLAANL